MANRSKNIGTKAESAVSTFLKTWWPWCERRAPAGAADRGDISGTPHTWEVKAAVRQGYQFPEWMKETAVERVNAGTRWAFLVVKPRGVAEANVADWWVIQPLEQACRIVHLAEKGLTLP